VKFFNLFHGIVISAGAYLVYFFSLQLGLKIYLGIPLAIILSILLGVLSEWVLFRSLRKRNVKPLQVMIASLGLYVIFQNLISMTWGDASLSIRQENIVVGNKFLGGYITNNEIKIIVISAFLFFLMRFFLKHTSIGKNIRAISSNSLLSNIFGINTNRVIEHSYILGSLFASIAGILAAYETGLSPNMGFNLFLYGAVVMIIGGVGGTWGLVAGAFLLAFAQNIAAFYISSQWMNGITYIILILFLIWKPLGFSGKRLKKVEI